MPVSPRNGLVLVRLIEEKEQKTKTGLYIPKPARGHVFEMAEVLNVGPGIIDVGKHVGNEDLKVGQTILLKTGTQVDIGQKAMSMIGVEDGAGGHVYLANQQDIVAIITPEPAPALTLTQ